MFVRHKYIDGVLKYKDAEKRQHEVLLVVGKKPRVDSDKG